MSYDIQATANCSGGALSPEQIQLMVQSMLEDRFQLKAHMETREGQVYNLVVAKYPPKIRLRYPGASVRLFNRVVRYRSLPQIRFRRRWLPVSEAILSIRTILRRAVSWE